MLSVSSRFSLKQAQWTLLAAFASVILVGCSEPAAPVKAPPPSVSVVALKSTEVRPSRDFVARTAASAKAGLTPRIEAEIKEILFREGSRVSKGDILVRLETTRANADIQQTKAELTAARAELESARRNLQRGEEVASKGYLSDADLDKLKDRFNAAESRLEAAGAAVQRAELTLEYTEIRAPFDGWIGRLNYDVGAVVSPATGPIADILVTDPIYVEFQLDESDYVAFRRAGSASDQDVASSLSLRLTLPDGGIYNQEGVVSFADVQTNESTGTVNMRAVFPNPDAVLLPGLYVTLRIEGRAGEAQVLVPQVAIQETIEGKFVLVVDEEQMVSQRFIQTGPRIGAMLTAESGLEVGERVIVEGLQKVRSGVTVSPVPSQIDTETGVLTSAEEPAKEGEAAQ
ncbi:efflux RND transporter periplasmic adaptor subunit [Marinobacter sp. 1-3A]|uniref:efflux RND transporter periplasmic adaptor subunit n=1 Tax=Marinobacter sp. 1-3A TaxID=2582920 RepID=UPI001904FB1A|nr:efflux RND transporter periplasmic adaptor subunit [Marinobacter sp. 1-3A]MBK1872709.1 efflux RND transporter periplasmic adaptor subunit [Marinobacter sp. 1-3A]